MIIDNFQAETEQIKKPKITKKGFSAGFIHQQLHKLPQKQSLELRDQDKLFSELGIGNLQKLYLESRPKDRTHEKQLIKQQKESIDRLYHHEKEKQLTKQDENLEDQSQKNKEKFIATYHQDQNYEKKAKLTLIRKFIDETKKKLQSAFKESKRKKKPQFNQEFIQYFLNQYEEFVTRSQPISDKELISSFQNYLNQINQESSTRELEREEFQDVLKINPFFSYFFNLQTSKFTKISAAELKNYIRKDSDIDKINFEEILEYTTIRLFTIPYERNDEKKLSFTKKEVVQVKEEIKYEYKANPIPKSVYQKPKQRSKKSVSKTEMKPFSFTQKQMPNKITPEEYYHFQKQFHARKIPKTTYEPNKIEQNHPDKRKERAVILMKEAKYPSTMGYLNNYNKYIEAKNDEILEKHHKSTKHQKRREIPDFRKLHHHEILCLEEKKAQNNHQTKIIPFNFAENKIRNQNSLMNIQKHPQQQYDIEEDPPKREYSKKIKKEPTIEVKSTKKHDAYANLVRKQKELKVIKDKEAELKKEKEAQKMTQYKNILKGRIEEQLAKSPHIKTYDNQNNSQNSLKIDLERIYQSKPLLMESKQVENKRNMSEKPKYTDLFDPII